MCELKQLLMGKKVLAEVEKEDGIVEFIEGTVVDVQLNVFYFFEKNEPVYIDVIIEPTDENLKNGPDVCFEDFVFPLEKIRLA